MDMKDQLCYRLRTAKDGKQILILQKETFNLANSLIVKDALRN
jgi:hypothetical protein